MKNLLCFLMLLVSLQIITVSVSSAQTVSTFEALPLDPDTYWDGSEMPNGASFTDGNGVFQNYYSSDFGGYWASGWSYSNMRDSTTAGFTNSYSAITGIGFNGSANYAVGLFNPIINVRPEAEGKVLSGLYITNATYAALSMRDGDAFAKVFGGPSGDDPDWFKVTFRSYYHGSLTQDSVEFYLADFRFVDNDSDYIVKSWEWVDLTSLGNSDSLQLFMSSSDTGDFGMNTPGYVCIDNFTTADYELFAPPVDVAGTTAIHKDSSVFVAWAEGATVVRGYQDISDTSLGNTTSGESDLALGQADADGTVSLGDGGSITLTFTKPITNGEGWDFAVFENSFNDTYLELAFVEVSSDGINFVRFPATSYVQTGVQVDGFGSTDATQINNLAGKYRALYGTPFDLEELALEPGLDINTITHVRVVDVVGSIQPEYATTDQYGTTINDPWPTPFPTSGFDLDAVGVIHSGMTATEYLPAATLFTTFPNPANESVFINLKSKENLTHAKIALSDCTGRIIKTEIVNSDTSLVELSLAEIPSGVYFISVTDSEKIASVKILVQK